MHVLAYIYMDDNIDLGGHIRLSGFRDIDGASMIIIKKIVGSFVKRYSEKDKSFKSLVITLKNVHGHESGNPGKYELHANMETDKNHSAEITHLNLMFAIDKVLKKLEASTAI